MVAAPRARKVNEIVPIIYEKTRKIIPYGEQNVLRYITTAKNVNSLQIIYYRYLEGLCGLKHQSWYQMFNYSCQTFHYS